MWYKPWTWFRNNSRFTSVATIKEQMNEVRALPTGMAEFEEWSDRIISGLPTLLAYPESQKFALAEMIMHLGPTESHKEDIYFLKHLLKAAVNQVAHAKMTEIRNTVKARLAAEEALKLSVSTTNAATQVPEIVADGHQVQH